MAKGSDCISHLQSCKTGTIAVIANGLKTCYPKEHSFLLDKIVDYNGCIISEYSYNKQPTKLSFLQRNKIIAGLSISTLIMRARQIKCGTMATANYARQFDKNIYTFLPKNGENLGNKWLLENNYATEIFSLEELKYNLLIDTIKQNEKIDNQQLNKDKDNKNLLFNIDIDLNDKKEIEKEINNILQQKNFKKITISNLIKVYNLILKNNPEFYNNNFIKRILFEKLKILK